MKYKLLFNKILIIHFISLLLLIFPLVTVYGASPSPAEQDVIRQRQKDVLDDAKQQINLLQQTIQLDPPSVETQKDDSGPCFTIQTIVFEGVTQLSLREQQHLTSDSINRCLSSKQINQLVKSVTNNYITKGYIISQAYVKQQDISLSQLIILVTEGKIENITLDGKKPLSLLMAFPGLEGKVVNLRDIEQGLEQLNRLSSQRVNIDILPGTKPGYSVIHLQHDPRRLPVLVSLGLDNSGQKSTGDGQIFSHITVDNLLQLADQWQFSLSRNNDFSRNHQSRSLCGAVSIPYGYWHISYQYNWNDFYQNVARPNAVWRNEGNSYNHRLNINRLLYRDGQRKLNLHAALNYRKTENRFAGQTLAISSPTLSNLTVGMNFSTTLYDGYLTVNQNYHQGLLIGGATKEERAITDAPRSLFRKYSVSASYFKSFTPSLYYLGSFYGQWSPHNLYASERIAIGGEYSVRGFKEQSLTGNSGAYFRHEFNWQIRQHPVAGTLSLTTAFG